MKLTEDSKRLPKEVLELIEKNSKLRELIRKIFVSGKEEIKGNGWYTSKYDIRAAEEKRSLLSKLVFYGLLDYGGSENRVYFIPYGPVHDFNGMPLRNSTIIDQLSDACIYAEADDAQAQILDEYLGRKATINGLEGLLMADRGYVRHISRFIDNTPLVGGGHVQTQMIRLAKIPVSGLAREGEGLALKGISSFSYVSCRDPVYNLWDSLLSSKGVESVSGNLTCELG
jgi:hypothetical protein